MIAPDAGTWHKARHGRLAHIVASINHNYGVDADVTTACGAWRIVLPEVADSSVERCKACAKATS